MITLISIKLRLADYRSIMQGLRKKTPAPRSAQADSARVKWLRHAVDISARFSPLGSCLDRSVTLWWLLAMEGVESQLRIGVKKTDGEFSAHAWLERNNEVVNDTVNIAEAYSVFDPDFAAGLKMR